MQDGYHGGSFGQLPANLDGITDPNDPRLSRKQQLALQSKLKREKTEREEQEKVEEEKKKKMEEEEKKKKEHREMLEKQETIRKEQLAKLSGGGGGSALGNMTSGDELGDMHEQRKKKAMLKQQQ